MDPIVLDRGCARIVGAPRTEPKCFDRPSRASRAPAREAGLGASRFVERGRKLGARANSELAVDARQVDFDRSLGDEERLRDLAVRRPFGRHLGHAPLARGQRLDAAQRDAPGTGAGGKELTLRTRGERRCAADRRQLDGLPKVLARVGAAVGPPQRRSQLHARLGVLELRRGAGNRLHRLLEQGEPALATLDQAGCTEGGAERPRGAPGAGQLDFLRRQPACLVWLAELEQGECGGRAPGDERWIAAADSVEAATGLEELFGTSGRIAAKDAQSGAAVAKKKHALAIETRLAEGDACERGRRIVELSLFHQRVGEERRGVSVKASTRPPGLAKRERLP